jgi:hypothetical protein
MALSIAAVMGTLLHTNSATMRNLWSILSPQFNFPYFAPQPYAPYFVSHTIYFHVYKRLIKMQSMAEEDIQNNITGVTWCKKGSRVTILVTIASTFTIAISTKSMSDTVLQGRIIKPCCCKQIMSEITVC